MHHHKMTRELRERRRKSSTVASFLPFEQFSVYNVMKCPRVYHAPASLNDQPQCSKRCPSSSASKNDRKGAIDQSKTVSDGTRTRNLPLRRRMPYPLGHGDAPHHTIDARVISATVSCSRSNDLLLPFLATFSHFQLSCDTYSAKEGSPSKQDVS